jgi:hypothetical protein
MEITTITAGGRTVTLEFDEKGTPTIVEFYAGDPPFTEPPFSVSHAEGETLNWLVKWDEGPEPHLDVF